MRRFGVFVLLSSVWASGCGAESVGSTAPEIVNGEPAAASFMPSVVALVINFPGFRQAFCSGTLVSKRWVVTAAHCVDTASIPARAPIGVLFGSNVSDAGAIVVPVVSRMQHPNYVGSDTPPGTLADYYDIGLVQLAADAPVAPALMIRPEQVGPSFRTGGEVLIMGFGLTDPANTNSSGVKYEGRTELRSVGDSEIYINSVSGSTTCSGDSGGPTFVDIGQAGNADYRLIGVTSRGAEGCQFGSVETRVDAYLSWIHENATDVPCDSGLAPACDGSGTNPAVTKKTFGESCEQSAECVDDLCVIISGKGMCSKLCDPGSPVCPDRHQCQAIDQTGTRGACVPRPPLSLGEACTANEECASSLCAGVGGANVCSRFCEPDKGCETNFQCVSAGGDQHICVPGAPQSGGGCAVDSGATSAPLASLLFALALFALFTLRTRLQR